VWVFVLHTREKGVHRKQPLTLTFGFLWLLMSFVPQAVFSVYCGQSPVHFDVTNVDDDPDYRMPLSTFTNFAHSCGGFNGTSIARFVKVLFLPTKVADIKSCHPCFLNYKLV
jgi:hypothetical protein